MLQFLVFSAQHDIQKTSGILAYVTNKYTPDQHELHDGSLKYDTVKFDNGNNFSGTEYTAPVKG